MFRTGPLARFHLGAMEDAVAQIDRAAGIEANRICGMMRIGGVHAVQDALLPIGFAVSIRVAHEP